MKGVWKSAIIHCSDHTVKLEALRVFGKIAKLSGSFIKQRVTNDVLPYLLSSLKPDKVVKLSHARKLPFITQPVSFDELRRITIKHARETKPEVLLQPCSVEYKIQLRLLKTLATLTTYLKFHDRQLYKIIEASYKFIHRDMPHDLQRHGLYLFRALSGVNPDLMWMVLHSLGGIKIPIRTLRSNLFNASSSPEAAGYKRTCSECLYGLKS
eukprot:sb/3470180/